MLWRLSLSKNLLRIEKSCSKVAQQNLSTSVLGATGQKDRGLWGREWVQLANEQFTSRRTAQKGPVVTTLHLRHSSIAILVKVVRVSKKGCLFKEGGKDGF